MFVPLYDAAFNFGAAPGFGLPIFAKASVRTSFKRLARVGAALLQTPIDLAGNLSQHPDQMRDIAARVVDVGLEQNRVTGGLVDLDAVLVCQDALKLRAIEAGGAAH